MKIIPKPYSDILNEYGHNLKYDQLLSTTEWYAKKNEIETRDDFRCKDCGNVQTICFLESGPIGVDKEIMEIPLPNGEIYKHEEIVPIFQEKMYYIAVHHLYYIQDKLPWEYKNEAFVTLCNYCHEKRHQLDKIIVYNNEDLNNISEHLNRCSRCNGFGYIPKYDHVENGICFKCYGVGYS